MVIYNKLEINDIIYTDALSIKVDKNIGDYNSTSNFSIEFSNENGKYDDTFNLNDEVVVGASKVRESDYEGEYISNFDLHVNNGAPFGLTTNGINIWTTDDTGDKVYKYDMNGNYISNWDVVAPTNNPRGIATDGINIWIVDNGELKVYKYDMVGNYISSWNLYAPNTFSAGITTDGTNIWTVDKSRLKIYKYDMVGNYVSESSIHADNINAAGITNNGAYIWIPDLTVKKVFKYTIAGVYVSRWDLYVDNGNPRGIAIDSDNIWVVDYSDDKIYKYGFTLPKIFTGIIDKKDFFGYEQSEKIKISGRDYGAILQDIHVAPRVWKDTEVSVIVNDIMSQNISSDLISVNNVNVTTTTIERITFQNISVFDALKQLAVYSGYFFYVDTDKDLHFEQKNATASGLTFNNTNITSSSFKTDDSQIFNRVIVYGDRTLSGHEQYFNCNGGSMFGLNYAPHNLTVFISGTTNIIQQPGGVLGMNNPLYDDVKWLVDFQSQLFVMTSGATAGDNIPTSGSDVLFAQYQKNTPIISVKTDYGSQIAYGLKEKIIADSKIKNPEEATVKAQAIINEHKDPKMQGDIDVYGVLEITPGETAIVNIPFHNINNQTYTILSASYSFNKKNNLSDSVLRVSLNKKIQDFTDTTKDVLLRLKQAEMSQVDANIITLQTDIGSVGISGPWYATSRSIGSAFYFHVDGHNVFDNNKSLLGDMRTGSIVQSGGF